MDRYITGSAIKAIREKRKMTQQELADKLFVSAKAVSKWETGKGLPDISLIEPLAAALGISTIELISGEDIINQNRSANMLRSKLYVCPVCANTIHSTGDAVVSCCGITLPPLEAEPCDGQHTINIQRDDNELYITLDHPMTKAHYISFIAAVSDSSVSIVRLYPEGNAEARFRSSCISRIYACCNRDGLFGIKL